ncbi:MAG: glycosyltransferase [Candidatus Gracilibacteria bacterium]|nr:glycosyltransferase [Candidatus Gracilibacteria bacterium]
MLKKYENSTKIHFLGLISRDEVMEYFKKSDFYIMPTIQDIFGMVFLEAFTYGSIPISIDTFAINNIINDGNDGFVIDYKNKFHTMKYQYIDKYNLNIDTLLEKINNEEKNDIINKIVDKLEFLINNREVRNEFILNGFEKVKNGKFSIKSKNNILENIYKLI